MSASPGFSSRSMSTALGTLVGGSPLLATNLAYPWLYQKAAGKPYIPSYAKQTTDSFVRAIKHTEWIKMKYSIGIGFASLLFTVSPLIFKSLKGAKKGIAAELKPANPQDVAKGIAATKHKSELSIQEKEAIVKQLGNAKKSNPLSSEEKEAAATETTKQFNKEAKGLVPGIPASLFSS
jgi:hypothetical protein